MELPALPADAPLAKPLDPARRHSDPPSWSLSVSLGTSGGKPFGLLLAPLVEVDVIDRERDTRCYWAGVQERVRCVERPRGMRRRTIMGSLLAVALLAGGCIGGSGTAAETTALVIRHTTAGWSPSHQGWREGKRHTDVYRLTCAELSHYPRQIAAVCNQLTRHPERYFGHSSVDLTASMPYTDFVTVSGLLQGHRVNFKYDAGAKPQFPWWSRALRTLQAAS